MINIKVIATGSKGNCIYVKSTNTTKGILLECGIPVKDIIKGAGETSLKDHIDAVLVSHVHKDHSLSILDMAKRGLTVAAPKHTLEHYNLPITDRCFAAHPKSWIFTKHWNILPIEGEHDVPVVGYWFYPAGHEGGDDYVFFFTDTATVRDKPARVNHLIAECNYDLETITKNLSRSKIDRVYGNRTRLTHMGLDTLTSYLHRAYWINTLRSIHLIHMSEVNCDWDNAKKGLEQAFGVPVYLPE